jgi:hypothetical protein
MKLTKLQLKQIVSEELKTLSEAYGIDWGGGHGAEHLEDWSPDQEDPERIQKLRQRWQDPKWSAEAAEARLSRYGAIVYKVEKERDEDIERESERGPERRAEAEKTYALTSDNIGLWGARVWNEYIDAKEGEWIAQQELAGYEAHLDAEKARDEASEEEQRRIQGINEEKVQLTKQQLKQIVKEELEAVLSEEGNPEINYEGTKTNIELLGMETKHDQTEVKLRINGEEHALLGAYDIDSLADGVIAKIEDSDDYWFLGEYGDADLESEFHGLLERTLEALGADPASASQYRGSYRAGDTGGY